MAVHENEKKIEESEIFYDPKPFSLDQGYCVLWILFFLSSFKNVKYYSWIVAHKLDDQYMLRTLIIQK